MMDYEIWILKTGTAVPVTSVADSLHFGTDPAPDPDSHL
jgi:hypothetical protein